MMETNQMLPRPSVIFGNTSGTFQSQGAIGQKTYPRKLDSILAFEDLLRSVVIETSDKEKFVEIASIMFRSVIAESCARTGLLSQVINMAYDHSSVAGNFYVNLFGKIGNPAPVSATIFDLDGDLAEPFSKIAAERENLLNGFVVVGKREGQFGIEGVSIFEGDDRELINPQDAFRRIVLVDLPVSKFGDEAIRAALQIKHLNRCAAKTDINTRNFTIIPGFGRLFEDADVVVNSTYLDGGISFLASFDKDNISPELYTEVRTSLFKGLFGSAIFVLSVAPEPEQMADECGPKSEVIPPAPVAKSAFERLREKISNVIH